MLSIIHSGRAVGYGLKEMVAGSVSFGCDLKDLNFNDTDDVVNPYRIDLRKLEFGEDETDATDEIVGWRFVRGERDELDGEVAGVGSEDEASFVEVDEAEQERGAAADGIECGLVGAVGSQRVVVAIEDGDGTGGEDGVHGCGLLGVGTDGEEALPVGVGGGGAGAVVVESRGRDLDGFDDGRGGDAGLVHGGGGRDDRNDFDGVARGNGSGGGQFEGKNLVDVEVLRCEDAVEAFEREGSLSIEEVRDMSLGQPGRLTQLEERVEMHERSVQRMKGLMGAVGGLLTVIHLAIDYLRR
jgi:hypothetical protein